MPDRDARLVGIRPSIPVETGAAGPMERFQSLTLRPILKLQNPLILTLVSLYLAKYCPKFAHLPHPSKLAYVRDILKRDSRPKHMLVGIVAGHFTGEEFTFFCAHEAEVRRRLVELCIQRVQDQIDQLPAGDLSF